MGQPDNIRALLGQATPGGPLLTVKDMLLDLSEEPFPDTESLSNPLFSSASPFINSSSTQERTAGLERQGLPKSFEETYNQLNIALKQSGHTWTGLTQELCATLTTADKLVATAHMNLGQLKQEVNKLEEIMKRGQDSILKLQSSLGQNTGVPVPDLQQVTAE